MAAAPTADVLPDWPAGTVCVLATTGGDAAHAIPVSTAVRLGDHAIALALARSRGSLARLRERPRVAVAVLAGGDVAFTAHGIARVAAETLGGAENVAAVIVAVDHVQSHRRPTFAIESGVAWSWTDDAARERDGAVRAALLALARPAAPPPPR